MVELLVVGSSATLAVDLEQAKKITDLHRHRSPMGYSWLKGVAASPFSRILSFTPFPTNASGKRSRS